MSTANADNMGTPPVQLACPVGLTGQTRSGLDIAFPVEFLTIHNFQAKS